MKSKLFVLALMVVLTAMTVTPLAAAPVLAPCAPGAAYDPACDVNHDGVVNVLDVQITAGHWNQTGTWLSDNSHNHLGQLWTGNTPLKIQGAFGPPDYAPLVLNNTAGVGLSIAASDSAVYVDSAGYHGLWVASAANNGLHVNSAGNDGVYVGAAGGFGVLVASAGLNGLMVTSAAYSGVVADTAQASGEWGFYTDDKIHGSNVLAQSFSVVAQVTGPDSLTAGDIVAVAGIADPVPGSTVRTPLVRLAGGSFINIVGVVESHLALTKQPDRPQTAEGETQTETPASELRSVDGPAQPGDYVAITVLGATLVKVQDGEALQPGQRVTAGADGALRALQTRMVDGMEVTEGAPTVGIVLESPKNGMVWVLVNPQ